MFKKTGLQKTDAVYSKRIIPYREAAADSLFPDLPPTPFPDNSLPLEHKITLCLNTKFKGKYHGPDWSKFNDSFKPVDVDAYEHAQAIRSGYATCPVVQGRRKKEHFVSAQHIGLDFDTEDNQARLDVLEADSFIAQHGVIIHTSASHTEEKPRARVFFYLDQPVTDPDQYRRYVAALLKRYALADQKAKDPARMFFGAENSEVRVLNNGHNRLPISVLESLAAELLPPKRAEPPTPMKLPCSDGAQDRAQRWALKVADNTLTDLARTTQGGRNDALNKAAYKLGQLIGVGLLMRADVEHTLINIGQDIGLSEHEAIATVRSGLASGEKTIPNWIPDFDAPPRAPSQKPVEVQIVPQFSGETLNYYPEGIPLTVIELLNGLHRNPWVHVDQGDIPIAKSFVALWSAWHEPVIANEIDPLTPVSQADLTRLTDMSKDAVRNALHFGEYGGFLSHYNNNNRGKESHHNTRGKNAQYYIFRPLREAWQLFLSKMNPLMWRALLIETYPDLPSDALAIADLLTVRDATYNDIAQMDDISCSLYEHEQYADAAEHLQWRVDQWWTEYIYPADAIPLRLPEGATFRNAAQFGDLLNEIDMIAHEGERKGKERYYIMDLTGRTRAAQRTSNKRLDIASIPDWHEHPVKKNTDIPTQCKSISPIAYERGHIRICAPNGAVITVSPYATFDYAAWLLDNGGYEGALIQSWEYSREKLESLLTEKERAIRDDISRRQTAISAYRTAGIKKKPSALVPWLIAQGEMRAALFGIQRIQDQEHPPHVIYIGAQGDVFKPNNIWLGIIQATRLEQKGNMPPYEVTVPDYILDSGETISLAHQQTGNTSIHLPRIEQ